MIVMLPYEKPLLPKLKILDDSIKTDDFTPFPLNFIDDNQWKQSIVTITQKQDEGESSYIIVGSGLDIDDNSFVEQVTLGTTVVSSLKEIEVNNTDIGNYRQQYQALVDNFILLNPDLINDFLQKHTFILPVLIESIDKISEYFEIESPSVLERYLDPEDSEKYQELFVNIPVASNVETALNQMDEFLDGWFLDKIDVTQGILNFNIDYV